MIASLGKQPQATTSKGGASLSTTLLRELAALVHNRTGLHYPQEKWPDLQRQVAAAAPQLGFKDVQACVEWLLRSVPTPEQMDVLTAHLTIGETFFFRDRAVFRLLREQLLPAWLDAKQGGNRTVRIWSAACCTGEEPYSVAMLLDQMAGQWQGCSMEILATDINRRFLEKAREGVYSQWSLRDTPRDVISRYFTPVGGNRYQIAPHIQRMVRFLPFNLAAAHSEGLPPGAAPCHLILCRNVLLYLSPETIDRVVERLANALIDGGWLIVGPSEAAFVRSPQLSAVHFPGAVLHRKGLAGAQEHNAAGTLVAGKAPQAMAPLAGRTRVSAAHRVFRAPGTALPRLPRAEGASGQARQGEQRRGLAGDSEEWPIAHNQALEQACVAQEKGLDEEAVKILEPILGAVEGHPESSADPRTMLMLARSLANLGKLSAARRWCERAVDRAKLRPEAHYLLAAIYHELGMEREAIDALKRTVYLDPNFVMAYVTLAHVARLQGKSAEAARHLASAVALLEPMDPGEPVPHSDCMTVQALKEALVSMAQDWGRSA